MNSAEVCPPCDVCAAIDSTDANRFFRRCCISPRIRRCVPPRCGARGPGPPAGRRSPRFPQGHGAAIAVVKAMKKLPRARPSADFTGRDLMRCTPCSVTEAAPQRIESLVIRDVGAGLTGMPLCSTTRRRQVPACGADLRSPGDGRKEKPGAEGITHPSKRARHGRGWSRRPGCRAPLFRHPADFFEHRIDGQIARNQLEHVDLARRSPGSCPACG